MEKLKATQEELQKIQEMNSKFNQTKIALGDCELQKHSILKHIEELRIEFSKHEKLLIEKYGADAVINVQTGEISTK
jgi:Ni2+-binding GTPase involved in maturation of urease and hydrogenase